MLINLRKHWEVVKEAYAREKQQAKQSLPVHHADFLPAALAVLEKPASPAGRFTGWVIICLFIIAILWACIGQIDVVAVAIGKTTAQGQTKIVQPFEAGLISAIHVDNGSAVERGEILIELDSTASKADLIQLRRQRQTALVAQARDRWLLENMEGATSPPTRFEIAASVDVELAQVQNLLAESQLNEFRSVQDAYLQQLEEKRGELAVVQQQLDKITETLPLLEEQVDGMATLSADGLAARFKYLEYEERLVARRKDLAIEKDRLRQVAASIQSIQKQKERHRQEFKKEVVSELAEATENLIAVEQELIKAEQSNDLQRLRAPVDGVVQQLAVHTIGGVVKPGEPLMVIVPSERKLQVEASILNKDIGFISEGQSAEVKLEAFPFTKYGIIHGTVQSVDLAAVDDENLGLIYPARINISEAIMQVNGKRIPLVPGMALTAEIKIGKRRIIEFLLSPLLRYKDESLRER